MSKCNIDYAFKSMVLNKHNDLLVKAKRSSLYEYSINQLEQNGIVLYALRTKKPFYEPLSVLNDYCAQNGLNDELKECFKINRAEYERTKRLKRRIESMLLAGNCLFLTLTFNDKSLATTTPQQRRVAVSRYLKSFNCKYIANIDFGSRNHREHYHAVIQSDKISFDEWRKYGNINAERVRNREINADKTKLAKYVCKLSNHAIKETTKRSCLIYSR